MVQRKEVQILSGANFKMDKLWVTLDWPLMESVFFTFLRLFSDILSYSLCPKTELKCLFDPLLETVRSKPALVSPTRALFPVKSNSNLLLTFRFPKLQTFLSGSSTRRVKWSRTGWSWLTNCFSPWIKTQGHRSNQGWQTLWTNFTSLPPSWPPE